MGKILRALADRKFGLFLGKKHLVDEREKKKKRSKGAKPKMSLIKSIFVEKRCFFSSRLFHDSIVSPFFARFSGPLIKPRFRV